MMFFLYTFDSYWRKAVSWFSHLDGTFRCQKCMQFWTLEWDQQPYTECNGSFTDVNRTCNLLWSVCVCVCTITLYIYDFCYIAAITVITSNKNCPSFGGLQSRESFNFSIARTNTNEQRWFSRDLPSTGILVMVTFAVPHTVTSYLYSVVPLVSRWYRTYFYWCLAQRCSVKKVRSSSNSSNRNSNSNRNSCEYESRTIEGRHWQRHRRASMSQVFPYPLVRSQQSRTGCSLLWILQSILQ